jgi:hypothetical protein
MIEIMLCLCIMTHAEMNRASRLIIKNIGTYSKKEKVNA